jgi:hypothetical protein
VPGARPSARLAGSKPPTRRASCLPIPPSRNPTGPETKRRMDFATSVSKTRREPRALSCRSKPPLRCPLGPPDLTRPKPGVAGVRTLRNGADALGTKRATTCVELQRRTSAAVGTGCRDPPPRGWPLSEALCRDRACQPRVGRQRRTSAAASTRAWQPQGPPCAGGFALARCDRSCSRLREQAPATCRASRPNPTTRRPPGSKAPCRARCVVQAPRRRRRTSEAGGTGRPSSAITRTTRPESTLPVGGVREPEP